MELSPYVDAVHRDLVAAAEAAGPEIATAAERLSYALDPSLRLALLDALGAAAAEIGAALPAGGGVEVRMRGRDPELVLLLPPGPPEPPARPPPPGTPPPEPPDADDSTARLTVRLPDSLKTRLEEAAAREGLSVNGWLVRAAVQSLDGGAGTPSTRQVTVGRRLSGWVR